MSRFQPSNLRRVLEIERDSFGAGAWPAALFEHYAHEGPVLFLVARSGRAITGYVIAEIHRGSAEIDSIAVHSRYRKTGVATALFRAVLRWARRNQASAIALMVRPDNEAALSFYRGLGFVRTAKVASYYEDGSPALRMRLKLTSPVSSLRTLRGSRV